MRKRKLTVIGNIALGKPVHNGQTAKTRDYIHYLTNRYGKEFVNYLDTDNWKKKFLLKSLQLIAVMIQSETLVLVLGSNGRKTILPLVALLKPIMKNKVLFSIVGGSLMYEFDKEKRTQKYMKMIDGNYVETKQFLEFLRTKGIKNAYYSPVFSKRKGIKDLGVLEKTVSEPYYFCTYSRVCREKGTSNAIQAIINVNKEKGKLCCVLDIFGVPQDDYREEFEELVSNAKGAVRVFPYLTDANAIETLSEHFMMLFPTYYSGEGFPIAIVECFKAGVPVIASNWHFNSEIVRNSKTGMIFELNDVNALEKCIMYAIEHSDEILKMKRNCIQEAKLYEPDKALQSIYKRIEDKEV